MYLAKSLWLLELLVTGATLILDQVEGHVPHSKLKPRATQVANITSFLEAVRSFDDRFSIPKDNPSNITSRDESSITLESSSITTKPRARRLRRDEGVPGPIPLVRSDSSIYNDRYLGKMRVKKFAGRRDEDLTFDTLFDTTYSRVIIPGKSCNEEGECLGPNEVKYDERGEKVEETVDDMRERGVKSTYFAGDVYEDSVDVGDWNAFKVDSMPILSVTVAAKPVFDGYTQAIVGLGLNDPPEPPDFREVSFIQQLVHERRRFSSLGLADEFSLFFGRDSSGTQRLSQLSLGSRNTELFTGPVTTMALRPAPGVEQWSYWDLPVTGLTVNGRSQTIDQARDSTAIFASADSLIFVPSSRLRSMAEAISGAFLVYFGPPRTPLPPAVIPKYQSLLFPCDAPLRLAFSLADKGPFDINPDDLSLGEVPATTQMQPIKRDDFIRMQTAKRSGRPICLSLVMSRYGEESPFRIEPDDYVLGIPFLRSWYSTYQFTPDGHQISLARAIDHVPEDSEGVSSDSGTVQTS